MSGITTHVLDTAIGKPAKGVHVMLQHRKGDDAWTCLSEGVTDGDGRVKNLLQSDQPLKPGEYRLTFDVGPYFEKTKQLAFYQAIPIEFHLAKPETHYHIPLLLSPYGYSTYRGS